MASKATERDRAGTHFDRAADHDVIIVGAGFAGLYALHRLRGQGLDAIILEAGGGVGGTWYWNRYPGARVDIDSMEYSYSFSEELQQEWEWSERYAGQAELLRYLNHVADRFDLRRSIQFNSRVASAQFDGESDRWLFRTVDGARLTAQYCVMATGFLSAPNQPKFPGQDSFEGKQYHTAYWPEEGVDFTGQRVGIIGTGSSAIQSIPLIAQQARHLTVFQRTPAYAVPLRNCPMPKEYEQRVKSNYAEWRRMEREESFTGIVSCNFQPVPQVQQLAMDVSAEERQALYDDRWKSGGLALYNVYPDVFANPEANETLAEYMRAKIRERVTDPAIAELLSPTDYPVLMKRLCADTNYYETYNRDNVTLVDVRGAEIEITPTGVQVRGAEHALDSIIFATGFDALTGALTRIDLRGLDGRSLNDHWSDGARTALGLMVAGFPNLFMLNGPGSPCPLFQPILLAEEQSNWVGDWITHMEREGHTRIDATTDAEDQWVDRCTEVINSTLFPRAASWYMGANIPGKPRKGLVDFGGIGYYRQRCSELLPGGFPGFTLSSSARRSAGRARDDQPQPVSLASA